MATLERLQANMQYLRLKNINVTFKEIFLFLMFIQAIYLTF